MKSIKASNQPPDACASIEAARRDDSELSEWREFVGAWIAGLQLDTRPARSIVEAAKQNTFAAFENAALQAMRRWA